MSTGSVATNRQVTAEILDGLAADDPAAIRSRADLRRVHHFMGTRSIVLRALRTFAPRPESSKWRILELGAGDGTLMLDVARACGRSALPVEITLVDRQALVACATLDAYEDLNWTAVPSHDDVLDWASAANDPLLGTGEPPRWDLIVVNLFLHHFAGRELAALLEAIADRGNGFMATEPRRSWFALMGSHCVGVLGAHPVTRHDAVQSVRAGFRDQELRALWPGAKEEWQLDEYDAGLFSHCFAAKRRRSP